MINGEEINSRARHLIRAAEGDLRRYLGLERLGVELVGELYIRVRNVLVRNLQDEAGDSLSTVQLIDDLALAIFLAVVQNEARDSEAPNLLVGLRRSLTRALGETQP